MLQKDPEIDILLTDLGLPGMNGRQLVEEARRLRPDLKVIIASRLFHRKRRRRQAARRCRASDQAFRSRPITSCPRGVTRGSFAVLLDLGIWER